MKVKARLEWLRRLIGSADNSCPHGGHNSCIFFFSLKVEEALTYFSVIGKGAS